MLSNLFSKLIIIYLRLHTIYCFAVHLTLSHKYFPSPLKLFKHVHIFIIFHFIDLPLFKPLSYCGTLFPYFTGVNYSLRNVFSIHLSPHFWLLFRIESFKWNYQVRKYYYFQGSWFTLPKGLPERSYNLYSSLTSPL